MALSDANFGSIRYKLETTWGETPSGSILIEAPITGESLRGAKDTIQTEVIRSDRMRGSLIETAFHVEGALNSELSYGAFDTILKAFMCDDFVTASVGASVIFGASTITFATSAAADQFQVGMNIRTASSGISANNGIFRIKSKAGNVIALNNGDAFTSTTASCKIQGRMLRNGTDKYSLFIEKYLTDVDNLFQYTGCRIGGMGVEVSAGEKVNVTFDVMGRAEIEASATVASVITSAAVTDVMNGTSNVGFIYEGGYDTANELSTSFMRLSFNATNNLRVQPKIGSKYPAGIGYGSFEVTGTIEAYFENTTLYQKFLNHTATSLSFRFTDVDGNVIVFTFPRIRFSNAPINLTGINTDVMIPLDFTAEADSTTNCMLQIDFLPITGSVT